MAEKQGLEAVARDPRWAKRLEMNPGNRERLLKMDRGEFIRVMRRWEREMRETSLKDPVRHATEDDLRRLSTHGTPLRIIAGCDARHPRYAAEKMAKLLPNAEFLEPPGFCEEWKSKDPQPREEVYYQLSQLYRLIDEFVTKTEAKAARP
jgi:hypothetical protein